MRTSGDIQDATPAALFSHITDRDCYGPKETGEDRSRDALENGGQGYLQPAAKCADNPQRGSGGPQLAAMTKKSI